LRHPFQRSLGLALLILGLGACEPLYPPIADAGSDSGFKYWIATHYGPGSRSDALRRDLTAQGFVYSVSEAPDFRYSATKAETNVPCLTYVRVDWNEDRRGRISLIQASRLQCR
jgi:hypothetical protein